MEDWERINRIVKIDKNTANKLVQSFDKKMIVKDIKYLTGGKSTSNYCVQLDNSSQYLLLKIYANDENSCAKEFAVHKKLRNIIPVPEYFFFDSSHALFKYSYAIIEFLDGITLAEYLFENKKIERKLTIKIGETLGRLHQFKYENEGRLDVNLETTSGIPPVLEWYEFFLNNQAGKRLGSQMCKKIRSFLADNSEILNEITEQFVLSHADFRPGNIMVKKGILQAIFDWEFCMSSPRYLDIGQFFRYDELFSSSVQTDFINGYNHIAKQPLKHNWMKKAKLMDLANLLCFLNKKDEKPKLFQEKTKLIQKTLETY